MNHPDTYSYVSYIMATPEKVWDALTNGEHTQKYFFGAEIRSDWTRGAKVTYWNPNKELDISGTLLSYEAGISFTMTWESPKDTSARTSPTEAEFKLTPMNGTVKLTITHRNLIDTDYSDDEDTFYGLNNGWPAIISNLKSYIETGKTLPAVKV